MAIRKALTKCIKLSSGYDMPILGLGTWKSEPGVIKKVIHDAIDMGYRHIDCAYFYLNEAEIGDAIFKKMNGELIGRNELFITSKLWNTFHSPEMVLSACKASLKTLRLSYLDLYLMHWPVAYKEGDMLIPKDPNGNVIWSDTDYTETWKAMETLVEKGYARSIGLSNFNSQQIERVLSIAKIKPAVNQIECHPYLNQKQLMKFCKESNISITAYSPLGSADRPWAKPGEPDLLKDEKLIKMAKRLGRTVAQVLLRFQVQRGNVVIPKSVHKNRLLENSQIFDFQLSNGDIEYLYTLNCNHRYCNNYEVSGIGHKYYPFNAAF